MSDSRPSGCLLYPSEIGNVAFCLRQNLIQNLTVAKYDSLRFQCLDRVLGLPFLEPSNIHLDLRNKTSESVRNVLEDGRRNFTISCLQHCKNCRPVCIQGLYDFEHLFG